jgi:hypothetical protein
MSRKELVLLVSRAFALLLITWAFAELTYLPDRVLGLIHHVNERSALAPHDYWSSYYSILTGFTVLRMVAFLFAATLFWKCGPSVEALFTPQHSNQNESRENRIGYLS